MSDINDKNNKQYSPWMNNWKDNFENPNKKMRNPQTARKIKILLWIGFFTILVSPIAIIIVGTLVKNEGIKEYKPSPFTEADALRFMDEAETAIHFGEYEKAIRIAEYVITENADIPRIYILACAANYYLADYQESIEFANEALKINPNFGAAKYLLAMCLYKIGSKVGEKYADVNIQPNNYPYSYYFGVLYKELIGDYKGMLYFAQKGLELDDKSPLLLFSLSRAYFRNSEFKKALIVIEMIKDKGDFNKISTEAIWRNGEILKAEILLKLNEIDDAEMILNRNYDNYPNWWQLTRVYAKLLIAKQNYAKSIELLEKYHSPKKTAKQKFDAIEMYSLRGYAKLMNNQLVDAYYDYMNIIEIETGVEVISNIDDVHELLTPACHSALLGLAQIEFKRDSTEKAQEYLKYIDAAFLDLHETKIYNELSQK